MTKMKSKKMTKSTFAIIIMAVALVAMLAFGGTYAYFTSTTKTITTGNVTTGTIRLTSEEATVVSKNVTNAVYDDIVLGAVNFTVDEKTDVDVWVVVRMTLDITDDDDETYQMKQDLMVELFGAFAPEKEKSSGKDVWIPVKNGDSTIPYAYARKVTTDQKGTAMPFLKELKITADPNWYEETQTAPLGMGAKFNLKIDACAIQVKSIGETEDDATRLKAYNLAYGTDGRFVTAQNPA